MTNDWMICQGRASTDLFSRVNVSATYWNSYGYSICGVGVRLAYTLRGEAFAEFRTEAGSSLPKGGAEKGFLGDKHGTRESERMYRE